MHKYRNTWVEVDLQAIRHNIHALASMQKEETKPMAVIKADGYGHGSVPLAKVLIEEGIDYFMVALLEEAITLRENGIQTPIIVITRVSPIYAPLAAAYNLTLTVYDPVWIEEAQTYLTKKKLQTHVEFETGMGRTGIQTDDEIKLIIDAYNENDSVLLTGVYTHFATADEADKSYFNKQANTFSRMLHVLQAMYEGELMIHTGNSAAGIQYPKKMYHYTRFGIATYGQYPSAIMKELQQVELKEAFSLYSELIQVKKITAGDCVSYGATYCAEADEWIGSIPIGYADGWSRKLQGFHVLINGKKMPIIGRICMDTMMVRLDQAYPVGTKVTLIGSDEAERIRVDDVAHYLDTINYEVTCMISSRVPRIYIGE